jgi:two-component system, sensor histidine kinase
MKRSDANKLVVVIDDDALVLEATESLLRSWGCDVVAAESCGDAVAKLRKTGQQPDLIVCDHRLPSGPNGINAIEILRSGSKIPALLVSADPTLPDCKDDVGYRLLHKPVNAATFRAMLVDASVLRPRK